MGLTDAFCREHLSAEYEVLCRRLAGGGAGPEAALASEQRETCVVGGGDRARHRLGQLGDDWKHEVLVEKILPPEAGQEYPVCVDGSGHARRRMSAGRGGYEEFAEAIRDPQHGQHEEYLEWAGEFDSEAFDLDAVNKELRRLR